MIIYPEYFDASLRRSECRRVSKSLSFQNPTSDEIARIARSLGYKASVEQKHHPAKWYAKRGRIVIDAAEGKEKKNEIIRKIAEKRRG